MGEETVISEGAATAVRVKISVSRQKAVGKKYRISPSLVFCGSQLVVAVEVSLLEHPAFLECMELCWLGWLRDPALCMPSP